MDSSEKPQLEVKGNRVKGLCFHRERPWVLASFHSGDIELYEYHHGARLGEFNEHVGPVRGVDFHCSRDLFVSGGDDWKIKVWNYAAQRREFELLGHSDYVRTVRFHEASPWLVSASDDQTARVWNWQSRQCLAVLSGHSHYVMCAQFHGARDLVVTASLDETVRIWDVSSLKEKRAQSKRRFFFEGSRELFSSNGVFCKATLEGHTRGVNWAEFGPAGDDVVSASDDHTVRLWRFDEAKAWETHCARDHTNNVSCALFAPPGAELVASASEDGAVVVRDAERGAVVWRSAPLKDGGRFWALAAHRGNGLFAAGHDGGFSVFRARAEFAPFAARAGAVFLLRRDVVVQIREGDEAARAVCRVEGLPQSPSLLLLPPRPRADDPTFVLAHREAGGDCVFRLLSRGAGGAGEGRALDVGFLAQDRLLLLARGADGARQLLVRSLGGEVERRVRCPGADAFERFFAVDERRVALAAGAKLVLFDVFAEAVQATFEAADPEDKICDLVWSPSKSVAAAVSEFRLFFLDSAFNLVASVREDLAIKSALWDPPSGALLFTNAAGLQYSLVSGEKGAIASTRTPLRLACVFGSGLLLALDAAGAPCALRLDRRELELKRAAELGDAESAERLAAGRAAEGRQAIGHLLRKGLTRAALALSRDNETRFELALRSGEFSAAEECARRLADPAAWQRLAAEALASGAFEHAEKACLQSGDLRRLAFLYFLGGERENLRKLAAFARKSGDAEGALLLALYAGTAAEDAAGVLAAKGFGRWAAASAKLLGTAAAETPETPAAQPSGAVSAADEYVARRLGDFSESRLGLAAVGEGGLSDWPRQKRGDDGSDAVRRMRDLINSIS